MKLRWKPWDLLLHDASDAERDPATGFVSRIELSGVDEHGRTLLAQGRRWQRLILRLFLLLSAAVLRSRYHYGTY
jgi:hypothetical protein